MSVSTPALFREIPTRARADLVRGYSKLAKLPRDVHRSLADRAARWLDPRYPPPAASDLPTGTEGVDRSVINAVTFQAGALFALGLETDAFVSAGIEASVLDEDTAPVVRSFGAEFLAPHHREIQNAVACARSSFEIVPSYADFHTTIDLRLITPKDAEPAPNVAPMVIAFLKTDVSGQHLLFQMTPRDVHSFHQQLDSLLNELREYENAAVVLNPERG